MATIQRTRRSVGPLGLAATTAGWTALTLAACGPATPTGARGEPLVDSLPVLSVTRDLHVGSVADPDSGFSRIGSVTVDREGLAYVAELQDSQIRVYDGSGRRVGTIGREGDGPGEFRSIGRMGLLGDTLWACDPTATRITLFTATGEMLGTIPAPGRWVSFGGGGMGLVQGVGLRRDGLVDYSLTNFRLSRGGTLDSIVAPDLVGDREGHVVDTVGFMRLPVPTAKQITLAGQDLRVPAAPDDYALHQRESAGLVTVARKAVQEDDEGTFAVTRLRPDGDTLYRRSYAYRPRPFTPALVDSLVARSIPYAVARTHLDTATVAKALKDALDLPPFQTPVSMVVVGVDGSVWLRREDDGGPTFRWIVLDPRGEPVGRFELPRSVTIRWARMGVFYGSALDDMGIPWLVRYRVG